MQSPIRERLPWGHETGARFYGLAGTRGQTAPRLAEYIVLAEFDIDSGSTVRHTYPSAVPGCSDDWFAEHMLPEGAHNHALDWTVMFLNRDQKSLDEDWPKRFGEENEDGDEAGTRVALEKATRTARTAEEEGGNRYEPRSGGRDNERGNSANSGGNSSFLHCINLVRKQDDPSARRGAVVKAMCICSRYHFIEVFRPMLMIALEKYFQTSVPEVLQTLFDALNTADIAGAPRPTPWERGLMRRGVADRYMGTEPVEHLPSTWTHMMSFPYDGNVVQASLPLYSFPDETIAAPVSHLINLFGQSVVSIYNAVLTGQRVLFVGYNHAAGDVCKFALAACALVSPPVEGILHRAFPYASLSDLSFLETPSFIAGVTNPMFEAHPEWWDVLCQLDVPNGCGTVVTSEETADSVHRGRSVGNNTLGAGIGGEERVPLKEALAYTGDSSFVTKLMAGAKAGKGESWVRCECRDYTQGLVNLVLDKEAGLTKELSSVSLDEKAILSHGGSMMGGMRNLQSAMLLDHAQAGTAGYSPVALVRCSKMLSSWSETKSFLGLTTFRFFQIFKLLSVNDRRLRRLKITCGIDKRDADPWSRCRGAGGGVAARGNGARLRSYIRRFQLEKHVSDSFAKEGFGALCDNLETEAELQVLLGMLPESKGGLGSLALGLLSTSTSARRSTVELFKKLESHESTRPAVLCMNDFFKLALDRQAHEFDVSCTHSPAPPLPPATAPNPSGDHPANTATRTGSVGGSNGRKPIPS